VDVHELKRALESVVHRAKSRTQGLDLFAALLHRTPPALGLALIAEIVGAQRDWPATSDQISAHFLDRIESAGVVLGGAVRNAYAVVAGRLASLLSRAIESYGGFFRFEKKTNFLNR
jgi:hypothetical protein